MRQALFTIAQDETDLLPLWVSHHRRAYPGAAIYVLDHDSVGDAAVYLREARKLGVVVVPVHHAESFDYNWLARTVEAFGAFLLRSHETVGFSEVDELLVPLAPLELSVSQPFARATGYCVVHQHPAEPDLRWGESILAQRKYWYRSERYSKVAMFQQPVYYRDGFHRAYNVPDTLEPAPDLLCVHLHLADYQTTLRRHQRNAGRLWAPRARLSPEGIHQRLDDPEKLQRYLLCDLDRPEQYAQLEEIPANIKERVCLRLE